MVAFFAYAAVWQASVEIGIATWWIGPRAQPTNLAVKALPFMLCITMAMCVVYNAPRVLRLSALGVVLAAAGALADFSRSNGLAVTELLIAALLGVVTAAAVTGRYRLAPTGTPSTRPLRHCEHCEHMSTASIRERVKRLRRVGQPVVVATRRPTLTVPRSLPLSSRP